MGLLRGLFERKSVDLTALIDVAAQTTAGVSVTESSALRMTAVWACIRVISEDVATLPLVMYERLEPRGKRRATEHPLQSLLHDQPNPEMTALQLRETLTAHVLGWGNAYCYIVSDNRGLPRELWPLRPDRTETMRDERTRDLFYRTRHPQADQNLDLPAAEVMHIAGLSVDGLVGYSPIGLHRQTVALGLAAEEFGARFFGQGTNLGGFIKHPTSLSEQALDRLKKDPTFGMPQYQGLARSHLWAILEEGMTVEKIGIPPDEAQFLESRKFSVPEICRVFRVPPHKVQDLERATFSNIEQQDLDYYKSTLRPWLVRWEQAIRMKLIPPHEKLRFFAEHLADALLRGDTLSRYQAYQIGRQGGWLSINDIRDKENLNPVDGGDVYLEPLNMVPVGSPRSAPA